MKKLVLLFQPLMVCLLVACAFQTGEDWMNDVAGRYVMQYQQPYSIGWDTLIIKHIGNSGSKQFSIQRHTKYQRLTKNGSLPAVLKITTRYVEADKSASTLIHAATGKRYDYNPTKMEVKTGNIIYYRLK